MKLPNGYGSIHKLQGNRRNPYRIRVTLGYNEAGKQLYETLGYKKTYTDGLKLLADYHNDPMLFKNSKITFEDVFNMMWENKENELDNSSKRAYTSAFANSNLLYKMPFIDIRLMHLQNAVNSLGDKYSAKKKMKTLYNQMYDFAIANDITSKKYSSYVKLGDKPEKEAIHKAYTNNEKQILWDNINKIPYIDVILIYNYTGFRPSELLDIKKDTGVNLEEKYLQGGSKTEAGKNRIVPIHHRILPIIEKWYNKDGEYLITNTKGKKMTYDNWKRIFINIMEMLDNMDSSHLPHDPRHTFSTDLDNLGANEKTLQQLVGHAGKNVTQKYYIHKDLEELRKAIELLP